MCSDLARMSSKQSTFHFGRFVLTPDAGSLAVDGEAISLRPKTMQVLEQFVSRPGVLITKNELFEAVWGDTVVTEDSLTQCIVELRRALDDSDKTLIQTVPRRGYRFHAEVGPPDQVDPLALKAKSRWRLLPALFAAGACLIAFSLLDRSPAQTETSVSQRVAVAELNALVGHVSGGTRLLTEALRLRLDAYTGISTREIGLAVGEHNVDVALERARSLDIDWLIFGAATQAPGTTRTDVRLWLLDTGSNARFTLGVYELPSDREATNTATLLQLRDSIVTRALTRLPQHLVDKPVDGAFPALLADFETYTDVMSELERERCNPDLARRMQPVVERSPNFMHGWMALAWAHWVDYWACGLGQSALDDALAAAERVLDLQAGYPFAIKVKSSALAAQGDLAEALHVVRTAAVASPNSAALWATLSYLLNYVGDLDESYQAMERALLIDPLVLVTETGETPNVYLYVGRWQRYLQTQPAFDAPYFNFQRAYAHFRNGELAQARRAASADQTLFPSDLYARFSAALLAIMDGRKVAAINTLQGITEQRDLGDQRDGEATYREAVMLMLAGANTRARTRLELAGRQGFVCVACVKADPVWAPVLAEPWLQRWMQTNATTRTTEGDER